MIRLSRLTDYAIVVMAELARTPGQLQAAANLAQTTGIPEPTVAKVMKILTRTGVVESARGVNGGYIVYRGPAEIKIVELVEALNGPVALTACVTESDDGCDIAHRCQLRGRWDMVNDAIRSAFSSVTLADMTSPAPDNACSGCQIHQGQRA
jgi:FeS assembly SUF system regulator